MRISSYPACCAFKIASEWDDLNPGWSSKARQEEIVKKLISAATYNPNNRYSAKYNNHILIAVASFQRSVIPYIRKYIKTNKIKEIKIEKITQFTNRKSGNNVQLYMIYDVRCH